MKSVKDFMIFLSFHQLILKAWKEEIEVVGFFSCYSPVMRLLKGISVLLLALMQKILPEVSAVLLQSW